MAATIDLRCGDAEDKLECCAAHVSTCLHAQKAEELLDLAHVDGSHVVLRKMQAQCGGSRLGIQFESLLTRIVLCH